MKKLYLKRFLKKIILLTLLTVSPIIAVADELNSKKWNKKCDEKNEICIIGILSESANKDGSKVNLITAYITLGSKTERKMDLVSGDEKTYKLKEKNVVVPLLNVNFPLNVDLSKNPLLQVDNKNILNLNYTHCNAKEGCATMINMTDNVIKLFKAGKELTLVMGIYSNPNNVSVKLPLKGFSKSYDSLLK